MPRKLRELRADLHHAGCTSLAKRGKGSHTYWQHPLLPTEQVTLAGHDGDDAKPYQEKDVRAMLEKVRSIQRGVQ